MQTLDTSQFTGSETWTRYMGGVLLTDGARYVADTASAWWLIDAIVSHQFDKHVGNESFQVWRLVCDPTGPGCVLTCEDGNGNFVTDQEIPFTDFPDDEVTLWLIQDGHATTLLLPSEY